MRSLITALAVTSALLAIPASPARAAPFLNDTFIGYPDHGWGDVIGSPSDFNTMSASSSFDGHLMTVTISTDYAGAIDGTYFGDLLLSPTWVVGSRCTDAQCDNPGTQYERGDWSDAVHLIDGTDPGQGAELYSLPSSGADPVVTSHVDVPGSWIYRDGQPVEIDPAEAVAEGTASASFSAGSPGTLTFTFAPPADFLTVVSGWITGYSFAIAWAPTCANDIIEGVLSDTGEKFPVPEPASLLLFGTGILGLGVCRTSRRSHFRFSGKSGQDST